MNRPGLQAALAKLDAGQADHLIAGLLDRISRSVADFAATVDRRAKKRRGLVLLRPDVGTTSAAGRFTAHVLASASNYERALIFRRYPRRPGSEEAGTRSRGKRLGRRRAMSRAVVERIAKERAGGRSLRVIAEGLNSDKAPTGRGGKCWYASTVKASLLRASALGFLRSGAT